MMEALSLEHTNVGVWEDVRIGAFPASLSRDVEMEKYHFWSLLKYFLFSFQDTGFLHRHQCLHTGFRLLISHLFNLSNGCKCRFVFCIFLRELPPFFFFLFIEKVELCFAPIIDWTGRPVQVDDICPKISVRPRLLRKQRRQSKCVLKLFWTRRLRRPFRRQQQGWSVVMVHLNQPSFCPLTPLLSPKCLTYSHVHSSIHSCLPLQESTSTNKMK